MSDREPWYRHTIGGQGRSCEDIESLVNALIIAAGCCAVVAIYLLIHYLSK